VVQRNAIVYHSGRLQEGDLRRHGLTGFDVTDMRTTTAVRLVA
jgi:hypothetical protein